MNYDAHSIAMMEPRNRARFINSLSGFKSANLIGTRDSDGNENLAIVSSAFHLGATPPLMGLIIRPSSVERHTLENILATECYTINAVTHEFLAAAHQTSARYSKLESEFEKANLTPYYVNDFNAPFVMESPLKLAMRLVDHQTLAVNGTEMVIGEIQDVLVSDSAVMPDGYVDIEALDLVTISGLDSYHMTQRIGRLSYAKPDQKLHPLTKEGDPSSWDAFGLSDFDR
ncbi:flavin reductase family protein [Vibrio sp. Of14-4]|uniref:flavin reductase family protein n=1 Tax=Vibrio sp. Of14-4 TaxID=2724878 RepID=UPI001EF18B9E|nr:flavin reductase [Vibrio sp. Of14-4]MCG7488494.1 flavin reductase family protein [Vibrio sp. Of14-4]